MESLKRLFITVAAGISLLTRNKVQPASTGDVGNASNRVSREVNHYRTHFFNL